MTTSRERILANLHASLASTRARLEAVAARTSHTPPPFVHAAQEDLAAQFAAELARLEGHPHRCADDEQALEVIRRILQSHAARSVIAWDLAQIGLPGLDALLEQLGVQALDGQVAGSGAGRSELLQPLEAAPVCLSGAELGIAESGSLLLLSGPGRGRLASLLAPTHIAVLRADRLVRGLGQALNTLKQRHSAALFDAYSNLTIITGPSRTADIELTLTLGVHGPKEIHVILIETNH
jgi:L-lactate dehydrogenase complex protein LldG